MTLSYTGAGAARTYNQCPRHPGNQLQRERRELGMINAYPGASGYMLAGLTGTSNNPGSTQSAVERLG